MVATTGNSQDVHPVEEKLELLVRQLREAFTSIHDLPRLQSHPLAELVRHPLTSDSLGAARALQGRLFEAIERLRPDSMSGPGDERAARRYNLLRLRYVEGFDVTAVCGQLGCSRANYFLHLKAGLRTIAAKLETELPSTVGPNDMLMGLRQRTTLVGREEEFDLLKAAFNASASGDGGRVVMIIGEQGIGKTRLAQELGKWVVDNDGLFLEGRWAAWEGAEPYGAVAEALRMGLRQLDMDQITQLAGHYRRDLARLFPEVGKPSDLRDEGAQPSPEEQQHRLYEGVATFVHNLSELQPIVMLLDDLHLAPQMSLQLHLARRLREHRLLIVYAYREDELLARQALVAGRTELIRSQVVTDIRLDPLSEAETGKMIAEVFGTEVAAQLQVDTYEKSHGNPFLMEEMLPYLIENDAVHWTRDHWEVLDSTRMGTPESVKLLVIERVSRLGDESARQLQQASVLGREFSFATLFQMSDESEDMLVATLERAVASGLLVDRTLAATPELYQFSKNHIHEALYESIPTPRRRRYHLRAGKAIRSEYPDRLGELAYHFTHGNDRELGASFSYQAAEKASSLFSWNRAIPLYQDALDLWEELGGHLEQRAAAAENLGNACYKSGIEAHHAFAYLQQASGFYEELDNHHKVAVVQSQLGRERMHGGNLALQDQDQALKHFRRATELLAPEPEGMPLGLVYCGLAMAHLYRLEPGEAMASGSKASELGQRLSFPAVVANALAPSGSTVSLSDPSRGRQTLELAWQTSVQNKLGFQADLTRACGARFLGVALKDPRSGLDWVQRGPAYDTTYSLFDISAHLVALHTLDGEFEKAGRVLGQPVFGLWPDEPGMLWIRRGQWDHAEAQLSQAVEWAGKSEYRLAEASASQKLGELYLMSDRIAGAERYLTRALELAVESASTVSEIGLALPLCELYLGTNRRDQADACLARVRKMMGTADRWGALSGDVSLAGALVAGGHGRWEEGDLAFEEAVRIYRDYALPWDEAYGCLKWANALRSRNEGKPLVDRADSLLMRARSLWDAIGAGQFAELSLA